MLIDYGKYTDQELLKHGAISGLEIAFKHAFDDTIADEVITGQSHLNSLNDFA